MKRLITICLVVGMVFGITGMAYAIPVNIDGINSVGEWDGATSIPVAISMGTVSVYADTSYMYVLFDLSDSTDARIDYPGEVGNDQIGINVNPTDGGSWGFPYDLIFETSALSGGSYLPNDGGHHQLPWNPKLNSGTIDGWASRWFPNNAQQGLPAGLQSATIYSGGTRITEWQLPLSSSAGDILLVGGAVDVGDGSSYAYPIGLVWNTASTFVPITVVPEPATVALLGLGALSLLRRRKNS